ncbi:MAG: NAD(P)-dependent oxidoreductase, partial [Coriobacteriia bacterium]
MKNIAVFGLGNMGAAIARNILKAGYSLTVYNRTSEKTKPLAGMGARVATTPAAVARNSDAIVSVVGDDAASRAVWLGADGALAMAPKDCIIVECSTLSVDWVRELSSRAAERGLRFVDAGLGGGPGTIPAGTMNLFVGAELATFDAVKPLLA